MNESRLLQLLLAAVEFGHQGSIGRPPQVTCVESSQLMGCRPATVVTGAFACWSSHCFFNNNNDDDDDNNNNDNNNNHHINNNNNNNNDDDDDDDDGDDDDDNNNNRIQRRYSRFFYNLHTAPRTVSNTYAQVARAQSCANHVQHIERLSRASVMLRATWCEGTAQLLSLTELKSHLFELYFIG